MYAAIVLDVTIFSFKAGGLLDAFVEAILLVSIT